MTAISIATPKTAGRTRPTLRARFTAWQLARKAAKITGNQLTTAALMTYLGADDDTILRFSGQLGKLARKAYIEATGTEPEQSAAAVFRGRLTPVYAYPWDQLSLLISVTAQYANTAALVAKIGS
jgi:hypothetical protein